MKHIIRIVTGYVFLLSMQGNAQVKWQNVDADYHPLPAGVHVFKTTDSLEGKPNIAFYVSIDVKGNVFFRTDTGRGVRYTPTQFYEKNNHPLIVMNCTFFEFEHNSNLNVVMNDGKMISFNQHNFPLRGKDTFMYAHPFRSAFGISKKRKMDVAWTFTDSIAKYPYAIQQPYTWIKDSTPDIDFSRIKKQYGFKKWKMQTAFGGGPVLLQNGEILISNNEERQFGGNAINDKHPRTAVGYTKDGTMILLVVQGRYKDIADGMTLKQEAEIFKQLNCIEAMNLDGGGSSCLLINGKETIKPSDKAGEQRPVPAVFIVEQGGNYFRK